MISCIFLITFHVMEKGILQSLSVSTYLYRKYRRDTLETSSKSHLRKGRGKVKKTKGNKQGDSHEEEVGVCDHFDNITSQISQPALQAYNKKTILKNTEKVIILRIIGKQKPV